MHPEASSHQEIVRGAAIGVVACLILTWLTGGSSLSFVAAMIWGSSVGMLIGVLLWIGSGDLPEEPILPPPPGQARAKKFDPPRPR